MSGKTRRLGNLLVVLRGEFVDLARRAGFYLLMLWRECVRGREAGSQLYAYRKAENSLIGGFHIIPTTEYYIE